MKTEPETKPTHSPEPWKPYGAFSIITENEAPIATCSHAEDREHIISCVNALSKMNPDAVSEVLRSFDILLEIIWISGSALLESHAVKNATAALAKLRQ